MWRSRRNAWAASEDVRMTLTKYFLDWINWFEVIFCSTYSMLHHFTKCVWVDPRGNLCYSLTNTSFISSWHVLIGTGHYNAFNFQHFCGPKSSECESKHILAQANTFNRMYRISEKQFRGIKLWRNIKPGVEWKDVADVCWTIDVP